MTQSTNEIPAWANRIAAWFFAAGCAFFANNWMDHVDKRLERIESALFVPSNHIQASVDK